LEDAMGYHIASEEELSVGEYTYLEVSLVESDINVYGHFGDNAVKLLATLPVKTKGKIDIALTFVFEIIAKLRPDQTINLQKQIDNSFSIALSAGENDEIEKRSKDLKRVIKKKAVKPDEVTE
jgi:hypothetical protein